MRRGRVQDRDALYRSCIHPLSFRGSKLSRFDPAKLIKIETQPDGTLLGSLAWERYVPTTELVHEYGCRLAQRMNEKDRTDGKYKEDRRKIYCGAYQITAKAVRSLPSAEGLSEVSFADAIHRIESGEIAHVDLKIALRPLGRSDVEGTKTAVIDRLWHASRGPLRHACDLERNLTEHPSGRLDPAPMGEYSDPRNVLARLWWLMRFRIHEWFWRKFCKQNS